MITLIKHNGAGLMVGLIHNLNGLFVLTICIGLGNLRQGIDPGHLIQMQVMNLLIINDF